MSAHDVAVIVPSTGIPEIVVPCVRSVLRNTDARRLLVVVVLNGPDKAAQYESAQLLRGLDGEEGTSLVVVEAPGALGFGRACNVGLSAAVADERGRRLGFLADRMEAPSFDDIPPHTVFLNDDARVAQGWLGAMLAAFEATEVVTTGEPPDEQGHRPRRPASLAIGRIGLVGPTATTVAGIQCRARPEAPSFDLAAAMVRDRMGDEVLAVDFLSGFCLCLRREALLDLLDAENLVDDVDALPPEFHGSPAWHRRSGALWDERFGIGGWEDNDLCVRAELAGWGRAVASAAYLDHVGHASLDRYWPEAHRGMANRVTYLRKWASSKRVRDVSICALYRVKLETAQDLHHFRQSLAAVGRLVDEVAILLNGNPLDVQGAADWNQLRPTLAPSDHAMLEACGGQDAAACAEALRAWAQAFAGAAKGSRKPTVRCEAWAGAFNERDERNHLIGMGEATGATWLFSVDHDEVPEPRVDRPLLERWLRHPDPMVYAYDVGFLTLWDSPRLARQDQPWGDGGSYTGGMRGFRLWRASAHPARPRRIAGGNAIGLHCGNCPDADPLAKRVSALRMLHYGYIRAADRARKHARYRGIDPNPNPVAVGGDYSHLVREEGMRISAISYLDGIGLTMLLHEGERPIDLARHLDQYHALCDEAAIVWTEEASEIPEDFVDVASAFGRESCWVHQPLADHYANARNAGLSRLRDYTGAGGMRLAWAWVVDPDELTADHFTPGLALRAMAECTDAWGFLQRFANHRPAAMREEPTISESIRMIRLDPDGIMRFANRIHEGMDAALAEVRARGDMPVVRNSPFLVHNPGIGTDEAQLEAKTRRYQRLLVMELEENPRNSMAWFALGLQYANDYLVDKAIECFQRSIVVDPGASHHAYRELGLHYLRQGADMLQMVCTILPQHHPVHQALARVVAFAREAAPDQPRVGLAMRGPQFVAPEADLPLPPFEASEGTPLAKLLEGEGGISVLPAMDVR